jgi:hypothetical protein
MALKTHDLWSLVQDRLYVDPTDLANAVCAEAMDESPDFRTRLLIRDSVVTLQKYWGPSRFNAWLKRCPSRKQIETIWHEDLGKPGFPFLSEQVVEITRPETIRQFLRELGNELHQPTRIFLGGSGALILDECLSRQTQDLDVVDELPEGIRSLHRKLDELTRRYRLQIAHFQSHYLPKGWEQRVHSLEPFGRLQVLLVDRYDIFLSKLFSGRAKDRDDLRALMPQLDKQVLVRRLQETTARWRAEESMLKHAQKNWQIVFGEELPS